MKKLKAAYVCADGKLVKAWDAEKGILDLPLFRYVLTWCKVLTHGA